MTRRSWRELEHLIEQVEAETAPEATDDVDVAEITDEEEALLDAVTGGEHHVDLPADRVDALKERLRDDLEALHQELSGEEGPPS